MIEVEKVEADARVLAESLKAAQAAGVGPAILLPALIAVFRETGLFSGSISDLNLPSIASLSA